MPDKTLHRSALLMGGALLAVSALAVEPPSPPPADEQKMKMDAPMSGGMMKRGMTKGDVRKEAQRKTQTMKPMMEAEEKAMPADRKP